MHDIHSMDLIKSREKNTDPAGTIRIDREQKDEKKARGRHEVECVNELYEWYGMYDYSCMLVLIVILFHLYLV